MSIHVPLAFVAASLVLAATPGPGVLYIVTRSVAQGRRAGLQSVAGVALGNLGNAVGAAVGLAALFALSSLAFTVVKLAGAAYLVWLGLQALRAPARAAEAPTAAAGAQADRTFREGAWVALLNPKTALFFAAFLPQFIDPAAGGMLQSVVLGAVFVGIAALTDTGYALLASTIAPALQRYRGGIGALLGRYATAAVYIGLGVYTALARPLR